VRIYKIYRNGYNTFPAIIMITSISGKDIIII
jgi:hypothetical protein